MLDQQSVLLNGCLESSQSLLLPAIRGFEYASESHQSLTRRGRVSKSHSHSSENDVSDMDGNVKRALDNISVLHVRLSKGKFMDDSEIYYSRHPKASNQKTPRGPTQKRLPALRRENAISGRPGLDPRLLHLESLLNFNILETGRFLGGLVQKRYFEEYSPFNGPQKSTSAIPDRTCELALSVINRIVSRLLRGHIQTPKTFLHPCAITDEHVISRPEIIAEFPDDIPPRDDEKYIDENSSTSQGEDLETGQHLDQQTLGTPFSTETDKSCLGDEETVILISSMGKVTSDDVTSREMITTLSRNTDLILLLKNIRILLELRYGAEADGLPITIVQCLHHFESLHQLTRHPTTDSIWNIDYQRQRFETFGLCDIGIYYRQKCICEEGVLLGEIHSLDVYCPRNQVIGPPGVGDELEWDGVDLEWRKKKTLRPTSPIQAESMNEEAEDDEVEDDEVEDDGAGDEASDNDDDDDPEKLAAEKAANIDKAMQTITDLVGLQTVKTHISNLKAIVETSTRQGVELKEGRFGTIFLGNAGTGKTTVARSYAKFLSATGVAGGYGYTETTGIYLADGGISRVKNYIDNLSSDGGVLFVDDAHQLLWSDGEKVLTFMLQEIENNRGKVIFVLAGYEKDTRNIMGMMDGNVASLMPYTIMFQDFTDEELLAILKGHIAKRFGGKMKVEAGFDGPYIRIAVRRIGKTRGNSKFGNARAVENLVAEIWDRQSARLHKQRLERKEALASNITEAAEGHATVPLINGATKPSNNDDIKDLSTSEIEKDTFKNNNDAISVAKEITTEVSEKVSGEAAEAIPTTDSSTDDLESDYFFTKEDIIGPSPTDAILASEAWKKLQRLTGLKAVKESVLSIFEFSKINYQRELEEKPMIRLNFNRLFLGPPGTGKTVVAKLYGQILAEVGVLSKGELIVRNPTDLIGQYIGDSEANTKSALSAAMGNVLVIDEAYMMYTGDGTGNRSDSFRQGVVDTLVAEIQSVPGEDRCVLMLGYGDQMREMLQNSNPGLARRFPIEDAFWFHDFTLEELESILRTKLQDNELEATEEAIKTAMDVLDKARQRLNFGNGGAVENLITSAKINYQKRISTTKVPERPAKWIFLPEDFDPKYDRGNSATLNLRKLFSDVVGCEATMKKLEQYQRVAQAMKRKNIDSKPFIPTNFVFKGPPGTGKTTTARKIAQVYYDMGFLSEASVVECSTSDLIGQYIGHTGPKTIKVLERSLGKVLLIDEAYRLAKESCKFTSEAISELVDCLTKPKFQGKLIVILAGYESEINQLLSVNPGLASRFPEELIFPSLTPDDLLAILKMKLGQTGVGIPVLESKKGIEYKNITRVMSQLAQTQNWGNAREMETLAKLLCREAFMNMGDGDLVCDTTILTEALGALLAERRARGRIGMISK